MQKKEKPRRVLAILIVIIIIIGYYYIAADEPFGIKKTEKITTEEIESLESIVPKEMYDFLFRNDSLKICLNSMAGYSYRSKTITVYDSITPESYIRYRYNWDNDLKKWLKESRFSWRVDTAGNFLGTITEEYSSKSQSWIVSDYDSIFYNSKGIKIFQKDYHGSNFKREISDDGSVVTEITISPYRDDTKVVFYNKKGKVVKVEEYESRIRTISDREWVLKSVRAYSAVENSRHTRKYITNDVDSTLRYESHSVSTSINDSVSTSKKYHIDSQKYEILTDSTISIRFNKNYNIRKHFSCSKEQKLVQSDIDSSYIDAEGNHYFYSKSMNYQSGDGYISYRKTDSLDRFIHSRWHGWYDDSTNVHKREKFAYYFPGIEFTKELEDVETEQGIQKKIDNIRIKFMPSEFNVYETSLYWNDESNCLDVMNITLKEMNKDGNDVEEIIIR